MIRGDAWLSTACSRDVAGGIWHGCRMHRVLICEECNESLPALKDVTSEARHKIPLAQKKIHLSELPHGAAHSFYASLFVFLKISGVNYQAFLTMAIFLTNFMPINYI